MAPPNTLPRTGSLFRRYFHTPEFILVYLFLTGATALLFTSVGLHFIFRHGHATTFPPEDHHVGWRDNPDSRGTLNVISVCISTIFTCAYVSVHIDVPDTSNPGRFRGDLANVLSGRTFRMFIDFAWELITHQHVHKTYWLLFNIFAPELMVLVALCELFSARSGVAFMRSRDQDGWTLRHAFFADMGGFKLRDGTVFSTGRAFYEWYDSERPQLDYEEIAHDIRDRSKANVVLKLGTCAQAVWMLIETGVRFVRRQPVSELEVTTCSYIVCAIVTYLFWLRKPYGVERQIALHPTPHSEGPGVSHEAGLQMDDATVRAYPTSGIPHIRHPSSLLPVPHCGSYYSSLRHPLTGDPEKPHPEKGLPTMVYPNARSTPFNRAYENPERAWNIAAGIAAIVGAIIGVMHAAPFWNALFVNTEGQWLWRACCVIQIVFPPMLAFILAIERLYCGILLWWWMLAMVFVYCISRTTLFALILLSFQCLPAGVYRNVDWSFGFIPHWH